MYRSRDVEIEGWTSYAARTVLVGLVLIVAPGLLLAAWYAMSWANSERKRIDQIVHHHALGIADAVDRQIVSTQHMLIALASSPALQDGDVAAFYRQASQVSRELNIHVALRHIHSHEMLFHTAYAYGAEIPQGLSEAAAIANRAMLATRKPQVSALFVGQRLTGHIAVVMVPVFRDGRPQFALSIALPSRAITEVLNRYHLEAQWVVSVIDQNGLVVARSRRNDEYVGQALPGIALERGLRTGTFDGFIVDEGPARIFLHRSEVSGWRVAVGVPARIAAAPMEFAVLGLATASLLLLTAAGATAYKSAGRLSRRLGAIETAAIVDRRLREEQFLTLAESVSNGIVAIGDDGTIVFANAQTERMFGYRRDELIGQPADMLVPARYRPVLLGRLRELADQPTRSVNNGIIGFGLRRDGTELALRTSFSAVSTGSGRIIMATMADLSAQEHAIDRLAAILGERDELRRRLMQAQEQERLRLARDLHDQTGQAVAAAMMELKGLEALVDQRARGKIRKLSRQLDDMSKALHRIARELRPASIDEVGLAGTLTDFVAEWGAQFGVAAEFFCGSKRIDKVSDEVSTTVYRVVQESLTNIAKHARGARTVGVVVDIDVTELRLTIEDDGCGFDPAAVGSQGRRRGLGIDGMRERLSLIGGAIEIESAVGIGTTLFVRIPLQRERVSA